MSWRVAKSIVVASGLLAVTLLVTAFGYQSASGLGIPSEALVTVAIVVVFATVGGAIVFRHATNPIGWVFCSTSVAAGLGAVSGAYAEYWLSGNRGDATLGRVAAVYESSSWIPVVLLPLIAVLLLFPDGRLPSPRWRILEWLAVIGLTGFLLAALLRPGRLEDFPISNPYAVDNPLRTVIEATCAVFLVVALVSSPAALVVRVRYADVMQRQQIKWLAWAALLAVPTFLLGVFVGYPLLGNEVTSTVILTSVLSLPVATGIGILRYRLYDIDVVINKTLVYGALTVVLAATYLGSVLVLQLALQSVTHDSGLAVAGSTLGVAGLFRPLRDRVQAGVDRRFYRRRYDARLAVESFAARMRETVVLGSVERELTGAVADTVQPASVTLWLRGTAS